MTKHPPTDIAASTFDRLKQRTRQRREDFNLTLGRFACERLLYRLSQSPHVDSFMLKGATLFAVWEDEPHRPTRDIDLLGFGEDSVERMGAVFADVCRTVVEDDGVSFDPASVAVTDIREGQTYQGKRVLVDGRLGNARLRVQIDVGFGDALTRWDTAITMPTLLDFPAPRLRAYPAAAVIAEKLHAMAQHGMLNSRMKDIYDVCALAQKLAFDGDELTEAIKLTFERRERPIGDVAPAPLTPEFAVDEVMLTRWRGFMARNRLEPLELAQAGEGLRAFLNGPLAAIRHGEAFTKHWPPAGPWGVRPG